MTFAELVAQAVKDFAERGFQTQQQLEDWLARLRAAAEAKATSPEQMQKMLNDALRAVYERLIERGGIVKAVPGVSRFTLANVAPRLRAELDRRILASANLIKMNREQAIAKTLQRFSGWATSQPKGGSAEPEARAAAADVKKALAQLPYHERRVLIDQAAKLNSSITAVVAEGGGAIAARWFSHWRQAGYDYREDHKERDQHVYLIRGSWAAERGLVKAADAGFTDQITQPAEEPFCRCKFVYLFNLRQLPVDMLTARGAEELERVRAA